jgi:hypothetical protein
MRGNTYSYIIENTHESGLDVTNLWGEPPALPMRRQKFGIYGSASLIALLES